MTNTEKTNICNCKWSTHDDVRIIKALQKRVYSVNSRDENQYVTSQLWCIMITVDKETSVSIIEIDWNMFLLSPVLLDINFTYWISFAAWNVAIYMLYTVSLFKLYPSNRITIVIMIK